jgi:sec-independent protein translocase protein TatA
MPFNLGMSELLIILLIVLVVFGAKRLPEIGAAMGKGIREFKRSLREVQESIESADEPPKRLDSGETGGDPKKLIDRSAKEG